MLGRSGPLVLRLKQCHFDRASVSNLGPPVKQFPQQDVFHLNVGMPNKLEGNTTILLVLGFPKKTKKKHFNSGVIGTKRIYQYRPQSSFRILPAVSGNAESCNPASCFIFAQPRCLPLALFTQCQSFSSDPTSCCCLRLTLSNLATLVCCGGSCWRLCRAASCELLLRAFINEKNKNM